jgi:hypothetical protein
LITDLTFPEYGEAHQYHEYDDSLLSIKKGGGIFLFDDL